MLDDFPRNRLSAEIQFQASCHEATDGRARPQIESAAGSAPKVVLGISEECG
jgi:hypothetical protein